MGRVLVTFNVDADGILHVAAEEQMTGKRASVQVKPSYGLDEDTIEKMLLDSFEHAQRDVDQRALVGSRVQAERIIAALNKALEEDRALLKDSELEVLQKGVAELKEATEGEDHRRIDDQIERLDKLSAEFAVRRMNRSIHQALGGQSAEKFGEAR